MGILMNFQQMRINFNFKGDLKVCSRGQREVKRIRPGISVCLFLQTCDIFTQRRPHEVVREMQPQVKEYLKSTRSWKQHENFY